MRSGLKNHRRHHRIEARINGTKAGRFAADVLEGLIEEREDEESIRRSEIQENDQKIQEEGR